MELIINGEQQNIPVGTITELVEYKRLEAQSLVVELNRAIIKQEQWASVQLKPGDRLELLSFVGGG
ncbi:sulfur carrier protein ThiS [Desulfobulbus alkaliphilus]|uniref:sulfur carrier protein ThiS n=1 Tax=Desulfobulbus alkaliphilus TaxID=869814 RepID=UPI001962A9E6|nr:sulfur carrier protein ThiS [Desulfobulbus alkaliphilus]MBM9535817.1 sulfur carrier protein ThiS [Desulfobulbus alkaliphilus]